MHSYQIQSVCETLSLYLEFITWGCSFVQRESRIGMLYCAYITSVQGVELVSCSMHRGGASELYYV